MNRVNLNDSPSEGKCTEGSLDLLRDVMTDEAVEALRQRNEKRKEAAILLLGAKYLLHPTNAVSRLAERVR